LSRIFQRLSVDNQTVLVASYFEKVVAAHDLDKPIPPIPPHLYPTLNPPVTSKIASVVVGNRNAIESGENQDDSRRGKRKRTAEVSEEDSDSSDDEADELDDDVGSGKGSDEDQQAGEGYVSVHVEDGESSVGDSEDDKIDVDQHVESHADRPQQSQLPPHGPSHAPTSGRTAHMVQVVTQATVTRPAHPAEGLTPAELENNWRLQAGDTSLKFTPQRSDPVCDHCIACNQICWTVPGQTACLYCHYGKKKSCSNTPARIRIPKEPQQQKVPNPQKPARSSEPKKQTPPKEATATVPSSSGRAQSKSKTRLDTAEPEPLTAAPPTVQKKPNVSVAQLLPPIDCLPVSTSVKVKVSENPKVDPSPAAPVLSPSSPTIPGSFCSEPAIVSISMTPAAKQGQSRSRAGSLSQPAVVNYSVAAIPDVFDPLVCPPVSDSEVRRKNNHYMIMTI
jgi:hypothetical protein